MSTRSSSHSTTSATRKPLTSSPLSNTSPPRQRTATSFSSSFHSQSGSPSPHHVGSTLKTSNSSPPDSTSPSSFQRRMADLRKGNSQLVSQSQRLLNQLENSSHKLLLSNSALHQQVANAGTSTYSTDEEEEENMKAGSNHSSLLEEEKSEWSVRQASLKQQVADAQAECRRIKAACSEVEQKAGRRDAMMLERPLSSQSFHGFPQSRVHSYLPPAGTAPRISTSAYPSHHQHHTLSHNNKPPTLNRSLSGSNSSLTSIKSMRETYNHDYSVGPSHSTVFLEGELDRARLANKRLQKQVSVLEQQLSDKTRSAEGHVQELSHLRTLLAKEKADHAMAAHTASEKAASELGRLKALHVEQSSEHEAVLKRLKAENKSVEEECEKLHRTLKASQSESKTLSDNVSSLLSQLEAEKASHQDSMSKLQREAEEGGRQVTRLQQQLDMCKKELGQCLHQVEGEMSLFRKEEEGYKQQIAVLSSQLEQCRSQLASGTAAIHKLQERLQESEQYAQKERDRWMKKEEDLLERMKQDEAEKQSLSHRLQEANHELLSHSQRLAGLQESSFLCRQQEGELAQLRRALGEQQDQRQEVERVKESMEKEKERVKAEVVELRQRLEAACQQLSEMQGRSENWRQEREQQRAQIRELKAQLEKAQQQKEEAMAKLKTAQTSNKEKENEVDASLTQMQMELTKRAQQVMELDSLLRTHQADTTAKRLQLERTLAQRQADLRSRTQEVEELSTKLSRALQNADQLREQLQEQSDAQLHTAATADLIKDKEAELARVCGELEEVRGRCEEVQSELVTCREREEKGRERIRQLEETCSELVKSNKSMLEQQQAHEVAASSLAMKEAEEQSTLQQQVQTLMHQERMRQEELARCRAQVASLSAELAVERQMGEETRKELAQARAGKVVPAFSLPPQNHLPTSSSYTQQPITWSEPTHTSNERNIYPPPPPSSSGHSSIIHI